MSLTSKSGWTRFSHCCRAIPYLMFMPTRLRYDRAFLVGFRNAHGQVQRLLPEATVTGTLILIMCLTTDKRCALHGMSAMLQIKGSHAEGSFLLPHSTSTEGLMGPSHAWPRSQSAHSSVQLMRLPWPVALGYGECLAPHKSYACWSMLAFSCASHAAR